MRQAEDMRFFPLLAVVQEFEAAVVKAAAHAEAVAAPVEANQRHENQVELLCPHQFPRGHHRFGDAEAVGFEFHVRRGLGKPQTIVRQARQHRQVAGFAHAPDMRHDRAGIDLAVIRQVAGNAPAHQKQAHAGDVSREPVGGVTLFVEGQAGTFCAQVAAQVIFCGRHGINFF